MFTDLISRMSFLHRMLFPEALRPQLTEEMMRRADVEPTLRPTELTIPHFVALADAYAQLCAREPQLRSYEFREELRLRNLARMKTGPMDGGDWGGVEPL